MKFKIENKYQDAAKFREPPCSPIAKDRFIELLSKGIAYAAPANDRDRVRVYESHVRIAKAYLEKYGIDEVVPDEAFFLTMWERLKIGGEAKGDLGEKKYSSATTQRAVRGIREIVSKYFFPKTLFPGQSFLKWNGIVTKDFGR